MTNYLKHPKDNKYLKRHATNVKPRRTLGSPDNKQLSVTLTPECGHMLEMLAETFYLTHTSIIRWALECVFWSTIDHYEDIQEASDLFNIPIKLFKKEGFKPTVLDLTKRKGTIKKWQHHIDELNKCDET